MPFRGELPIRSRKTDDTEFLNTDFLVLILVMGIGLAVTLGLAIAFPAEPAALASPDRWFKESWTDAVKTTSAVTLAATYKKGEDARA